MDPPADAARAAPLSRGAARRALRARPQTGGPAAVLPRPRRLPLHLEVRGLRHAGAGGDGVQAAGGVLPHRQLLRQVTTPSSRRAGECHARPV
eukprot:9401762-Pyramimonas_sp.AAC.1